MNRVLISILGGCLLSPLQCFSQQVLPDAPKSSSPSTLTSPMYSSPSQGERFKTYIKQTYGISSILEAGTRGGIDQARDRPSEWPEGAQGYADRFGSALGQMAVRNTTEYVVGDIFREDLRFLPCTSPCSESRVKRALGDTFAARRGNDGHRTFSVARFVGPITGAVVAKNTWYPTGYGTSEVFRQAGLSYALGFIRNYIRARSDLLDRTSIPSNTVAGDKDMRFTSFLPKRCHALANIKAIPYALTDAIDSRRAQIFRFLLLSVRNAETAERLTRSCLSMAYREWLNLNQHASTTSWLMSIAIHVQRRYERQGRFVFWRKVSHDSAPCAGEWTFDERSLLEPPAPVQEHIKQVWNAVAMMGEDERTIFLLRFVEDLNCGDIADAVGLDEEAVQDHLLLAVHRVRMTLAMVSRTAPDSVHL